MLKIKMVCLILQVRLLDKLSRETEIQRDRKTEKQRQGDRKTKRQEDIEAERLRDRQIDRETVDSLPILLQYRHDYSAYGRRPLVGIRPKHPVNLFYQRLLTENKQDQQK